VGAASSREFNGRVFDIHVDVLSQVGSDTEPNKIKRAPVFAKASPRQAVARTTFVLGFDRASTGITWPPLPLPRLRTFDPANDFSSVFITGFAASKR
jgi:hypothetical protein